MRIRTLAVGVLAAATISVGFTGTASAADRDCPDFASQADAQTAFDAVAGDPLSPTSWPGEPGAA